MRLIHIIPADEHHPRLASKHCNLEVQIVAPMQSRDNVEKVTNVRASNRESIASQSIRRPSRNEQTKWIWKNESLTTPVNWNAPGELASKLIVQKNPRKVTTMPFHASQTCQLFQCIQQFL